MVNRTKINWIFKKDKCTNHIFHRRNTRMWQRHSMTNTGWTQIFPFLQCLYSF